ncbi:MAG: stage II sporulation protein M [Anaerolineales bacterium]|nr:stage II sporulation protein M [Anaerolineales bacterium]
MTPEQLYQNRQADWQRLTGLLDRAAGDASRLSPADVTALGDLYRSATSDLALAQRDYPNHRVTIYLNQLVARAHAIVYRGEPLGLGRIWRFVRQGYPRLFRESLPFFLTAFLLFSLPALIIGLLLNSNPEAARWVLPVQVQEQLIPMIEERELWVDMAVGERPIMASAITTNNIQVSFLAFAGGILAGLLTVYVLIFNGLMLGGLLGLTAHYDVGFELATFVVGHGAIELSVIFIAGGAGLMVGWHMLRPGLLSRRDAVAIATNKAVKLIVGCVPLLVIAGTIESFISPAESLPPLVKWGVGLVTGVGLYGYLLLGGK